MYIPVYAPTNFFNRPKNSLEEPEVEDVEGEWWKDCLLDSKHADYCLYQYDLWKLVNHVAWMSRKDDVTELVYV